ncbi:MAG: cobalamin-dependent protein [Saprospiraceae bacterium]|nr:cobalamin-dependent protein [Saprospiraceae bacterium]
MKIMFIRPKPSSDTIGLQHLMIVEPLELEVLGSLVNSDDKVQIVDMILEKEPVEHFIRKFSPDVLCITGYITHIPVMVEYARTAKLIRHEIITIVGGVHVEKHPEDIDSQYIDYRIVRNATRSFPKLLEYLKYEAPFPEGVLKHGEKLDVSKLPKFDFYFPFPNRSLTDQYRKNYFYVFHDKVALMKTSFGCPYKCNFCYCRYITDDNYFARPLTDVIEELMEIKEKEIYIVDDDFLLSPKRVRSFIELLRKHQIKKRFLVYGRADFIIEHPEIIEEFQKEGLRTIIVGLESFKDSELDSFNKKTSQNINEEAMRILQRYGVDCYAAIITAPDWSYQDFKMVGDKIIELGLKFVNLQPLTPLKGVDFDVDDTELVIKRNDFPRWDLAHVSICPSQMSLNQYYRQILYLYDRITFNPKTILNFLFKYPLYMQFKLAIGMFKVRKQYLKMINETAYV